MRPPPADAGARPVRASGIGPAALSPLARDSEQTGVVVWRTGYPAAAAGSLLLAVRARRGHCLPCGHGCHARAPCHAYHAWQHGRRWWAYRLPPRGTVDMAMVGMAMVGMAAHHTWPCPRTLLASLRVAAGDNRTESRLARPRRRASGSSRCSLYFLAQVRKERGGATVRDRGTSQTPNRSHLCGSRQT